ncbi:hypothetical protein LWE61_11040 [Sphingobium sufflavum]|uniref:hypothetical protein n=1 Tax=Sphingobium sufflavum TaxID=1129547 RepID=UPI001F278AD3|nr:hypothetical protein [Sphingobium sufflavum]MCE7797093.1 hypothetical protein [Sphingobium sufflavum]
MISILLASLLMTKDVATMRSDGTRSILIGCIAKYAAASQKSGLAADQAFDAALTICDPIARDFRKALEPVAEHVLQAQGVEHYGQQAVDTIADETFNNAIVELKDTMLSYVNAQATAR